MSSGDRTYFHVAHIVETHVTSLNAARANTIDLVIVELPSIQRVSTLESSSRDIGTHVVLILSIRTRDGPSMLRDCRSLRHTGLQCPLHVFDFRVEALDVAEVVLVDTAATGGGALDTCRVDAVEV